MGDPWRSGYVENFRNSPVVRVGPNICLEVDETSAAGLRLSWTQHEQWRDWARLSEEAHIPRINVEGWSDEDLWRTYIQLTEAEAAFRTQTSERGLRPIWHRQRVPA